MQRLDKKSMIIFFFQGFLASLGLMLFLIPLGFVFAIPAAIFTYATANQDTFMFLLGNFIRLYLILIIVVPFIWSALTYYSYSYEVEDKTLNIHRGLFWKHHDVIPLHRIQSVTIDMGPVMQLLDLATLTMNISSSTRPDGTKLEIKGISVEEAQHIRALFLQETQPDKNLIS